MNAFAAMSAIVMLVAASDSTAASAPAGATLVFNYPNGFAGASGLIRNAWEAIFSGSALNLTPLATAHQAGGVWYTTPQNITAFTTDFTFQLTAGTAPSIQGITFTVQNSTNATNPGAFGTNATADANLLGYGAYNFQTPILNSVAVKFDLSGSNAQMQYPAGRSPNATGLYINGGPAQAFIPEVDLNPAGINLHSGDTMAAHIVYDGSILTMTLRDTVSNAQVRMSWPIDIPAIVGGNSAYVGFTGGTIQPVAQKILSWSFSEGFAPRASTPSFSLAGGSYTSAQSVSISSSAGATIYYTTNGQQPTSSSNKYTGPISVSASEVVQAIAVESGFTDSVVGVANYQIAPSGTPLINLPNGFAAASNLVTANGSAKINGSALQLTDSATNMESGSAWYAVPVNVQSFTTNFTLQLVNAKANGMTFAIQNQPPVSADKSLLYVSGGPHAVGNNAGGLGYSGSTGGNGTQTGLSTSIAVKFDLYGGSGDTTGLYTNGADVSPPGVDMTSSGVSLHSGNPLNVTLGYDGATLSMTITDSKTKASFSKNWAINIPSTVGGNTAYVGFTGATGGLTATQNVLSWTYATSGQTTAAIPAPPTNLRVQ
jgi:hypothetical protein